METIPASPLAAAAEVAATVSEDPSAHPSFDPLSEKIPDPDDYSCRPSLSNQHDQSVFGSVSRWNSRPPLPLEDRKWERCFYVFHGVRRRRYEDEASARKAFAKGVWSSVLFHPSGEVAEQKTGRLDVYKVGVEEIFKDKSWRSGDGQQRWVLGSSLNLRLRWETFSSEDDALRRMRKSWWSKVLFTPSGQAKHVFTGPLDTTGSGTAGLVQAYREGEAAALSRYDSKSSRQGSILEAMNAGEAPFIPRERGAVVRRSVQFAWRMMASRKSVSFMLKSTSLCYFDIKEYPNVSGFVALTIDDAPCRLGQGNSMMREVLELLRSHEARATFMVMGKFAKGNEGDLAEALKDGHELGNHGNVDRKYDKDKEAELAETVQDCTRQIADIQRSAGVAEGVRWFRAPHGRHSGGMARVLRDQGLTNVMCDTYACCPVIKDSQFIGEFLCSNADHGSIIVLHMPEHGFREWCFDGLRILLEGLEQKGLRAVTVGELADRAGYDDVPAAPTAGDSPTHTSRHTSFESEGAFADESSGFYDSSLAETPRSPSSLHSVPRLFSIPSFGLSRNRFQSPRPTVIGEGDETDESGDEEDVLPPFVD